MADTITILKSGNPNTVPNNTTWKWIHGIEEDKIMLELHGNLHIKDLEIISSDPKFITSWCKYEFEYDYNTKRYVLLTIKDKDRSTRLASGEFIVTIRNIKTKNIIANITITYNDVTNKDVLTFKNFRFWATNSNYGNGFTTLTENQSMLFGFTNVELGMMEQSNTINNLTLEGKLPYCSFNTMYGDTSMTIKNGPNPTFKDESGQRVSIYKPVFNPQEAGAGIIQRVAKLKGQNDTVVGVSEYFKYYIIPLSTDNSIPTEQMDLPWNKVGTVAFNTQYPKEFNLYISEYPELPQKQEGISMVVDNQQSDLVKVVPYIENRKFKIKVLPIKQVVRGALVSAQFHYHNAWDNGKYKTIVHRYDLTTSSKETPIDISGEDIELGEDGVYEIKLYVNETKYFKIYSITDNDDGYKYTIADNSICTVNKHNNSVTGLLEGTTIVTFSIKHPEWEEGSIDLRVIVLPLPTYEIELGRKIVIVNEGESKSVSVTAKYVKKLTFKYSTEGKCEAIDSTDYDSDNTVIDGAITIHGIEQGNCTVTVQGYNKEDIEDNDIPVITEYIDVIVVPKGEILIMATPNPCKIRLRKDTEGVAFTGITSANFIDYEMPDDPCFKDNSSYGPIETTDTLTKDYNTVKGYLKPIKLNKQILHLYAHNGDNEKLATLDVVVRVLDNVEVPKDEIWVTMEHAQDGVEDDKFDNPETRFFTILKWIKRADVDKDVYSHTIYLPNRNGTLATKELVDSINKEPKRYYEYANPGDPTRTINPTKKYSLWLNTEINKIWRCLDNEPNFNLWVCEDGRQVGPAEKLIYPGPGMPGYGQGPMSIDLHHLYGLEPLPGCYKSRSNEYGHYKDKYGNIYIYIPKFYTKLEGSN